MGYLDDERFARTKALSAAQHRQHGPRRAMAELLKAGADPSARSGGAGLPRNYVAPRVNTRAVEEAQRRREQPIVPFMEWVRTRSAAEAATGEARCHERGDPQFGWCDTSHAVEGTDFHSRFWASEPRAVRFSVTVRSPFVC